MSGGSGAGDATSPIAGGGQDLTRSVGQVKRGDVDGKRSMNIESAKGATKPTGDEGSEAAKKAEERKERAKLEDLKGQIEAIIEASPSLRPFKNQLLLEMTPEGLKVQIVDEKNRPMFDSGSANLLPHTKDILHEMGKMFNDVPNRLSVSGHTDATPYVGGERGYSNWDLSADRANAARRELLAGGMQDQKILRVVGLGSANPLDKQNAVNPINRRIAIVVLNKQSEEQILGEHPPEGTAANGEPDTAAANR